MEPKKVFINQDRNNAMCYFGLRKLTTLNDVPISKLNFILNYHIYFMKYQSLCYDTKTKYNDTYDKLIFV